MDLVNNFSQNLPGLELSNLVSIIGALGLASLRVGSFFLASPLFGYRIIPLQVRIIISFAISFIIFNNVVMPDIESLAGFSLLSVILVELLIGLTSGILLTILFSASSLAGEKISASTGLALAALVDPESGTQTPVISQVLSLFMIVVFLSLDGHLLALSIIFESYKVLPIGATNINISMLQLGIDAGGLMFKFGALIMLPIVVGITLLNVIIGIVTRSAPSLNLFSFGFPIIMCFAFFLLYVCTITIGSNFSHITNVAVDFIHRLIEGLM